MNDIGHLLLASYVALTRIAGDIVGPVIVRRRLARGKEDPARFRERLGYASLARPAGPLVWIHAASVGESVSVMALIEALAGRGLSVLITTVTTTSAAVVASRSGRSAIHQFAPLDLAPAIDRFLAHWRPDLAIMVESEIWPVSIARLARAGTPVVIANGRMSPRSTRGWLRVPGVAPAIFGRLTEVLAQSDDDAARFRALGVPRATPVGNLKFDTPAPDIAADFDAPFRAAVGRRPIFLAASTHPGEEAIALDAFAALRRRVPEALLVIAPRHPARGEAVAGLAAARFATARRATGELPGPDTAVYVADSVGEMGTLYRLATVAVIGGTLVDGIGGHNPIEPAQLETALVSGPYFANWTDIYAAFRDAGGLSVATDAAAIAGDAALLITDAEARRRRIAAADAVVARHAGALGRSLAALEPRLRALAEAPA